MPELISLKDIVMLPETQVRTKISPKTVDEYAEGMKEGVEYDPIHLVIDEEGRMVIADGAHRFLAAQQRGVSKIKAEIHKPEEGVNWQFLALEISLDSNGRHGLRLTPADKRKAVSMILADTIRRRWSDRKIATICKVSPGLVADVRKGEDEESRAKKKKASDKKSKLTYTPPEGGEHTEDSDPSGEYVRSLKEWMASGKIEWADVAPLFSNAKVAAVIIPRKGGVVRLIKPSDQGKAISRDWNTKRIEQIKTDSGNVIEIELGEAVGKQLKG